MPCYNRFAHVYDCFMSDAPYAQWIDYIDTVLRTYLNAGKSPLVLDMACGTGNMTVPLSLKGYDMIGTDQSPDMLSEARDKASENGVDILFLAQDMRRLDLYGTVDAVLCVCDGLNYLADENELYNVFNRVTTFLNPGGIFIFDMNTEYKFQQVLGDQVFSDTDEEASYLWKNYYDAKTGVNEYHVQFFIHTQDGHSETFEETHYQRAFAIDKVTELLKRAGLRLLRINEAYTDAPPAPNSERLSYITQK